MIIEHVWDHSFDGITNIVDVYVRHLRSKVDDRFRAEVDSHGARRRLHHRSRSAAMMNTRSLRFRITAWYAGLLAGTLMVFGASYIWGWSDIWIGLFRERWLSECRTIGTELLSQLPAKDNSWLATEINEAYAPEVNGLFIRVVHRRRGSRLHFRRAQGRNLRPIGEFRLPSDNEMDGSRKFNSNPAIACSSIR